MSFKEFASTEGRFMMLAKSNPQHAEHLFATSTTRIGVRKGHYLRDFAVDFICRCAPELDANAVRQATA